ncbi:hypothetical protein DFH09DRAFT_1111113 [Mycena vulgaris]|nr:hypothetical protein DFH09DRAFT_1111103 [Mycena vulgaris]KAJ6469675.1 hypothetical protein DFH09DRAFT_1111113 [Mycena vulgaris]
MLHILTYLALLSLTKDTISTSIMERNFDAVTIDGKDVPTTTDFPAPQNTDGGSDINTAYRAYIQECGINLQQTTAQAVDEYHFQFHKDPDNPTAPEFIAWAYSNFPEYMGQYMDCENRESTYKALLATFIPETSSATSTHTIPATRTGKSSAATATGQGGGIDDGNSDNGSGSQNGGQVVNCVPSLTILALALISAAKLMTI